MVLETDLDARPRKVEDDVRQFPEILGRKRGTRMVDPAEVVEVRVMVQRQQD